jgi:hypothetical protein
MQQCYRWPNCLLGWTWPCSRYSPSLTMTESFTPSTDRQGVAQCVHAIVSCGHVLPLHLPLLGPQIGKREVPWCQILRWIVCIALSCRNRRAFETLYLRLVPSRTWVLESPRWKSYGLSSRLQTLILNLNPEIEGEPSNIQHLDSLTTGIMCNGGIDFERN